MSTDSETSFYDEVFEGTEEEVIASDSETNDSEINDFEDITISTTSTTEDLSMVKVASSSETNNMFLTATDSDVFPASLSELLQKLQLASTSEVISTESNLNTSLFGASPLDGKRPIWIQSHHCNSRGEVQKALNAGCNAIEIDIRYRDSGGKKRGRSEKVLYPRPCDFWLAHNAVYRWLDMTISEIIEDAWKCKNTNNEHLCFIMLDIKMPQYIPQLSKAVHDVCEYYYGRYDPITGENDWENAQVYKDYPYYRSYDCGKKLYIIYSIASADNIMYFTPSSDFVLRKNEGICVDQEERVYTVENTFKSWGYENCWFGDGRDWHAPIYPEAMRLKIKPALAQAAALRDKTNGPIKKIESWTVNSRARARTVLFDMQCDSVMISDELRSKTKLNDLKKDFSEKGCYFATINDNPFKRTVCDIDWYLQGICLKTEKYSIGAMPKAPFVPDNPGFLFTGWTDADGGRVKRVTGPTKYYANFKVDDPSKNNHAVRFHYNIDDDYEELITVENGDIVPPPDMSSIEKVGYDFVGWCLDEACTNVLTQLGPIYAYTELWAKWTKKKYHISFVQPSGSTEMDYLYEDTPVPPAIVEPAGQEFIRWDPEVDVVTKDVTYNAIFESKEKVTLYIDTLGGKPMQSIVVGKGSIPESPRDYPEREGYDFAGYCKDKACTVEYDFSEPLYENTTIFVKWTPNTYIVTWNFNGITETESLQAGTIPAHATPAAPSSAYVFLGWDPEIEPVYKDVTYTANFVMNPHTDKRVVSFNSMGGSTVESQIVELNSKAYVPIKPSKYGYDFDGWYTDSICTTSFDFDTLITTDTVLYAKWIEKRYLITYNELTIDAITGKATSSVFSEELAYGVVPSRVPIVAGYTFVGWEPALVPVVYKATYTARYIPDTSEDNQHVVYFDAKCGMVSPTYTIVKDGATISEIPTPTRAGYDFDAWCDNTGTEFDFDNTPITSDGLILYAKWIATTSHKIIWKDGDTIIASASYYSYGDMPDWGRDCGDKLDKPGYIFTGWEPTPMPVGHESEKTYRAIYKQLITDRVFVSFDTRGGSYISTQFIGQGEKVATPSVVPEKSGHTFTGWYSDENCTTLFDFSTEVINVDKVIYAGWEIKTTTIYWMKDGVAIASNSCTYGGLPEFPWDKEEDFKKQGFIRIGWNPSVTIVDEYSASEVYYEAVYGASIVGRHWVAFDSRGGTAVEPQLVIDGYQVVEPAKPTLSGYDFNGWYTDVNCTVRFDFYTAVTSNMMLYAGWTNSVGPTPTPTPIPARRSGGGSSGGGSGGGGGSISRGLGNGLNNTKENAIACQKTGIMNVPANNFWVYNQIDNTWEMRVVVGGITAPLTDGFYKVNDQVYYFDIYGRLTTGWVKDLLGNYFYFEPKDNSNMCAMATGWRTIDGKNYNFGLDGVLLSSN